MSQYYTPEQFGAVGDGITNDQPAFDQLNMALAASKGGVVSLMPNKVYVGGKQTGGKNGLYLWGEAMLSATGLDALTIQGNGSTMRHKAGMKFGSFDPNTGNAIAPSMPFTDTSRRADIGCVIEIKQCGFVRIFDLKIDCNAANQTVGGEWGDTGRQCAHYGVFADRVENMEWDALEVRNSLLDSVSYAFYGMTLMTEPKPFVMRNCKFIGAGRNNMSQIGGNQVLAENCLFKMPGRAITAIGTIGSAPASCYDVEAEGATARNIVLRDCTLDGLGGGTFFVSDSGDGGDYLLDNCMMLGAGWFNKPRIEIRGGTLNGVISKFLGGTANRNDSTKFIDVHMIDDNARAIDAFFAMGQGSGGAGPVFRNCRIELSKTKLDLVSTTVESGSLLFKTGTDKISNLGNAVLLDSAMLKDWEVVEAIPSALQPVNGFGIFYAPSATVFDNCSLTSASGKLKWLTGSADAGGFTGVLSLRPSTMGALMLSRGGPSYSGQEGAQAIHSYFGMPTYGRFTVGDFVFYSGAYNVANWKLLGWTRLTTGSAHVLNTDWAEAWVSRAPKQAAPLTDLPGTASLADVVADLNALKARLRTSTQMAA